MESIKSTSLALAIASVGLITIMEARRKLDRLPNPHI